MKSWFFLASLCALFFSATGSKINFKENSMAIKINDMPQYLYKVISLPNWQVTQKRENVALSDEDRTFIHLSTEDQVEKVLAKYWSDIQQFVILKVDTGKLKGRLVYEINPAGTTKYFHLYEGCIPFNSIAESKIIYRQPPAFPDERRLDVVQLGEPVLRSRARELYQEEILSPKIQKLIEMMKFTMRDTLGVGLAAPQIGEAIQLVVIEDMDQSHLTSQQIAERHRYPVPFHVIINPRIFIDKEAAWKEFFEGCLSVPSVMGVVPRAESVCVEYLNERAEPVTIRAEGWYARILQHEIDHLNGVLFIDRAILSTLTTEENYVRLWKGKTVQEIKAELLPGKTLADESQGDGQK